MTEQNDATQNEVLETIMFVLAYSTAHTFLERVISNHGGTTEATRRFSWVSQVL